MSSNIKIISPYMQQNGGDSVLTAIELSSQNTVKEISVEMGVATSETYTASLTGTTGNVTLGPKGLTNSNLLQSNQRATAFLRTTDDVLSTVLSVTASGGDILTASGLTYSTVEVSKIGFTEKTSRDISHLFNVNANGEYIASEHKVPLQEETTSFGLLRTNPKLTGNVKVTVDSAQDIWMNSIDANKELADSRFKKVPLSYNSNYAIDLRNFFDKGTTPPEIVYSLHEESSSYFSTQRKLSSQYDRFYTYGAYQLADKSYDEDFAFFAPLKIDTVLPEYFVIFRTDGPFNPFSYTEDSSSWTNFINSEIIKKSSVVKTYDLTAESKIGKYIRNLLDHPARKSAEMTVSFQQDGYTTFNGIEYKKGSFAQKGELLSDFYATPNTVIGLEEFLTLGFQRNNLISANMLNLEFLFDDADATDYSINRYFGLYLTANEIASFFLSDLALSQFSGEVGQTPVPRPGIQGNKLSTKPFVQTNENGIRLYVDSSTIKRTNFDQEVFNTLVVGATGNYVYFPGEWGENPYLSIGDSLTISNTATNLSFTSTVSSITQEGNLGKIELATGYTGSSSLINAKADFYTAEKATQREKAAFESNQITDFARIFYVQDKNGDFFNISSTREVNTKINSFDYRYDVEITAVDRKVDISNFSGPSEMLTQAEAKVMTTKGKATLELEVTNSFQEGDTIEIAWYLPNSTEPTRWKIQASGTQLMPGEVWPDYSILTDIDSTKYYYTTFHPGISTELNQVALTIKKAFDAFPFKIFDSVVLDNRIFIKSRVEGEASNNIALKLDINQSCLSSYGYDAPVGISTLNFIGGSEKIRNRARIPKDVAKGVIDSEYFKIVGSYSTLKKFYVWGNEVLYFPYLEVDSYDSNDVLVDFIGKEDYAMIEVETGKIDLTFDEQVTSYNLFRGKYGIFSIFPIKDFDSDYFTSDYAKNYDPELLHYFKNSGSYRISSVDPISGQVVLNTPYEPAGITGAFDVPFIGVYDSGKSPKDYNGQVQLHFDGPGYTASAVYYKGPTGSWNLYSDAILLGTTGAPESIVPLEGDQILFFEENDLSKFKGFFSLSSITSEQDLQKFSFEESQWNFDRFTSNHVNTEYMRAYENFTKEYALTSKVVPYVCKWVSLDGKDVRDNPYRFNYNRAFGTMNFSPSAEYTVPDTRFHTHEWSYLANVPYYFDPSAYTSLLFSYFFEKPDLNIYNFKSVTRDWFSEYFTVGYPTELYRENNSVDYSRVPVATAERYSVFKYDTLTNKTYTIFRGVRLEVGELFSEDGAVLIGSQKYENYKFSSIVVPVEEDDNSYHTPLDFEIIVNEKYKFILNIVKIKISSYKNPEGNVSYVDLYTLQNKRDRGTYVFNDSKIFSPSPGVIAFNYNKGVPADVMLEGPVNLVNGKPISPIVIDTTTVNPLLGSGEYTFLYGYKAVPNLNSEISGITQQIKGVSESKFTFDSGSTYVFNPILKFSSNASSLGTPEWLQYKTYYASGGDEYYSKLRNLLSFYEISRALTGKSDKITPLKTRIMEDGTVTSSLALKFGIVSPEQVIQYNDLIPVPDENKPPQLYSYDVIGMDLTTYSDPQFLYRYQGDFTPKFKNVFYFASREEKYFSLLFNDDFRLGNTLIVDSVSDTYRIRNQYYNKVADEEILRIPPDSGYQSIYPAAEEISIDRRDLFVWSSSWDKNYYRKYSTVSLYADTKGTAEMTEVRSFLGSKMMKLPKAYSLYQFDETEYSVTSNTGIVKDINDDIFTGRKQTSASILVDVYAKFLRELKGTNTEQKARAEFEKIAALYPEVIDPTEVDTKTQAYIESNIINLFQILRVNVYVLESGDKGTAPTVKKARPFIQTTDVDGVLETYTEKQFYANGYKLLKNVKTIIRPDLKLEIQIPLDSRYYTSIGFGVDIDRI